MVGFFLKLYRFLDWEIKKISLAVVEWFYLRRKPKYSKLYKSNENFDIYVIAYGNSKIIELLIQSYILNFSFKYNLFIFDNSLSFNIRKDILNVCLQNEVNYVGLPSHSSEFKSSQSHAIAINWVFKYFILKRNVQYYAFLDHDVFPLKKIMLSDLFQGADISGILIPAVKFNPSNSSIIINQNYSFLWPGFFFFNKKHHKELQKISYMPFCFDGYQFDTGGKTHFYLKKINSEEVRYFSCKRGPNIFGFDVDLIDDKWLQPLSGSNWRNLPLSENYESTLLKLYASER